MVATETKGETVGKITERWFFRIGGALVLLLLTGLIILIFALGLGLLVPDSCIFYSAECQSHKMEMCIKSEYTLDQCTAIVGIGIK